MAHFVSGIVPHPYQQGSGDTLHRQVYSGFRDAILRAAGPGTAGAIKPRACIVLESPLPVLDAYHSSMRRILREPHRAGTFMLHPCGIIAAASRSSRRLPEPATYLARFFVPPYQKSPWRLAGAHSLFTSRPSISSLLRFVKTGCTQQRRPASTRFTTSIHWSQAFREAIATYLSTSARFAAIRANHGRLGSQQALDITARCCSTPATRSGSKSHATARPLHSPRIRLQNQARAR